MRVTAEVKAATRQRILDAATKLFATDGFEACTTRQIAEAAEIATGTLFNYFAAKETVLAALVAYALASAQQDPAPNTDDDLSFEEALFAFLQRCAEAQLAGEELKVVETRLPTTRKAAETRASYGPKKEDE